MASLDQVVQQIRFGLEQLRVKNAHHEFEHLSRHYARILICSNILPATGPVSAGGDQARDFETFRTYLAQSPIADTAFAGRMADDPVAFACTIQRENVEAKIQDDVQTILASGTNVLSVHYFCVADVPVARRHQLQAWARENYSLELEIHDGQAIAENLAQKAVFWIAERFLAIPSDIYPRDLFPTNDEYELARKQWVETKVDVNSFSQLHEIKGLLRHATWDNDVKQDIPFWISHLQLFVNSSEVPSLARRARYEIAVATFRGLGTLVGHEQEVQQYFAIPPSVDALDELEDYTVLLIYCSSATGFGDAGFAWSDLCEWQKTIIERLETAIAERTFPSTQAQLFKLRGQAALHRIGAEGVTSGFDETVEWWSKALDLLPQAALFPLEQFADMLTIMCKLAGDRPRFGELTGRVDEALSNRVGGFAAAEKCRDRAFAHYESGRVLDAISEIHKAKLNWFAEETLDVFVLSLQVLARWYTELGLCLAGKYYGLTAASIALSSSRPDIKAGAWKALLAAADSEYTSGAWAGFLELTGLALHCHYSLSPDPGNILKHDELLANFFYGAVAVAVSERLWPELAGFVKARVDAWNLGQFFDEPLATARNNYGRMPQHELVAAMENELVGMPINDIGVNRRATWAAFGIEWSVEWQNDYRTTALAEQFIATFQILLAETARKDFCLPQMQAEIKFSLDSIAKPVVQPLPSREEFCWHVRWPEVGEHDDLDRVFLTVFSTAMTVLQNASFLPDQDITEMMNNLFENGLPGKTLVGQPYARLYRGILSESAFNHGRQVLAVPEMPIRCSPLKPHPNLPPITGPGPGYSLEESQQRIAWRYQRVSELLPQTLPRLQGSQEFQETVRRLREKGWKDWHVLGAILTSVVNFRAHQKYGHHASQEDFREFMETPERPDWPEVPLTQFTEEHLDLLRKLNMASVLKNWGLESHHPSLVPEVFERFLATRYGYWSDDVEHPDPFAIQQEA